MRRLIQMLSVAAACGVLSAASTASACSATHAGSQNHARAMSAAPSARSSILKKDDAAPKKGALDDRLVRPHPRLDASAGSLG